MSDDRLFEGGVLSSTLEGGRAGARVHVGFDSVSATTAEGERLSVPYGDCVLSLGGASGRMWFFKERAGDLTIISEDPKLAELFETRPPRLLQEELARVLASRDAERKRQATFWIFGILGAGLLVFALVFGLRGLGRAAVHALPLSIDKKLGELAAASMDLGGTVSSDPVLVSAVAALEKRLAAHVKPKTAFKLRIVQSDTVNAFALPGGNIVVYTGLLREAGSIEEVAGVLAHEMAHVTRRHGMERIAQSLGVITAIQLLLGDVSGLFAVGVELLQVSAINSYSREQEHEADMDGVDTLLAAHVDPEALAQFFQRLISLHGDMPSELAWLGTHPELERRVADVRARAKKETHAPFEPFAIDFANVKKHAGAVLDDAAPAP